MMEDLDQDIRDYIERETQDNIERGLPPEEARYAALRKFGNVTRVKEEAWEVWSFVWLDQLWQDARFGLRTLRKAPGFACVAVLTLALGIGANTAIFSVVEAVLLRPLPFKDPSHLFALHEGIPKIGYSKVAFSPPDLAIFVREQKSFSAIGAFKDEHMNISGQGEPERVTVARISASLFPLLGAQPMLGRMFVAEEDAPGHQVAVLSYGLWQRRYGAASNIVGRRIELDRQPYIVIGVMPRGFVFPLASAEDNGSPADLWVPMALTPAELQDWGGSYLTSVVGRLRPGATLDEARGEAHSLARAMLVSYPTAIRNAVPGAELTISVSPFQRELVGSVRTLLLVLMSAVSLILLIACANIAILLLSRAAMRQKEIAVRTALGASRLRLVRQMLAESLLLAVGGGALGLLLAFWARNLLLALVPSSIPLPRHVPLNGGVLVFAAGVSILAAVLFGFAPALQASFRPTQAPLQGSGRSATAPRSEHRLQGIFVTVQFGLALVLLIAAGLLIRSFVKLLGTNPGFRPDHVLTLNIPLPREVYPQGEQVRNFYRQLLDRASRLRGVERVGLSNDLPLNAREMVSIAIEGQATGKAQTPQAICQSWVMGSYFQTMGIPLLEGRWFGPEDRLESQPVAIVSLSMARKLWPGQAAVGKRVRWGVVAPWQTVVGVVGDVSAGPLSAVMAPHVYRPYSQLPAPFLAEDPFADWHAMNLALRTRMDPASLTPAVVADVHMLDPDLAVASIQTMTEVISSSFAGPGFSMALLGTLAVLALVLSAIGVYGVLAHVVTRKAQEIGIRIALGAKPQDVLSLVLGRGARLIGIGVAFGLLAALGLTQLMKGLLYGVTALDPLTFVAVLFVLYSVGLLACYLPARRATKVDPMVALRYE
jgi:putative ABC transport system permease protein